MKLLPILAQVRDYLESEAQRPLSTVILRKLGELRNEEQRRK